ncbi:GrpB family protein [Clostridium botulinum]|uniref:GrpB family protein n=1 Tax=Clostridium botulinum TaxID=1491 RepID=UPI00094775F2|nr:GrpB family protein [Clostridium botulinum]APQ95415.1 grpB family protein [Clostridium botulinum]MBN3360998.1 GrpB family protein [Clostridium botulinum]
MKIQVVHYNPKWEKMFYDEASKIRDIIKEKEVAVIHIGSTSVPDLKAKPIIDILLVVQDINSLDKNIKEFNKLGYEAMGEFGLPGRRYFRKGGDNRTHQIHAYQFDNISEIQRHISFRNYLRKHRDIAEEYGDIKESLAKKYPNDTNGYCDGKDLFVKKVEAKALQEHWQSEV